MAVKVIRREKQEAPECFFTKTNTEPNYKDVLILRRFISDKGKIIPASRSGVTSKNQRILAREIKKARYMALLPYTDRHSL
jgi:small subunit ribosomal protein S18